MRRRILGLCMLVAGCIDVPGPQSSCDPGTDPDYDHDGWRCDGPVPDCDDHAATVNPGAFDQPNDGVDQDCSGADRPVSPALDPVSVVSGGAPAIVSGGLTIGFSVGSPLLPDTIIDNATGINLLTPSGVGVRFPDSVDTSVATGDQRTFPLQGPGVAEADVRWRILGVPTVSGHTQIVVRADSSVIRAEDVFLGQPGFPGPGGPYDAGAFLALDAARFGSVQYSANLGADPIPLPSPGMMWQGPDAPGWICLTSKPAGRSWSATWLPSGGEGPSLAIGSSVALGYDWARAAPSVPENGYKATQIFRYAPGHCGTEVAAVTDMTDPLPIVMSIGALDPSSEGDADHDGYDEVGGWYFMTSDTAAVQFAPPVGRDPIAVRVTLADGVDHGVTVWQGATRLQAGVDYLFQLMPSTSSHADALIWLATSFAGGEQIRIVGPEGEP